MSEQNLNLYQKIQAVANEVMTIDKDMKVGTGSYAYKAVSDLSVTKRVKEAELKHGITSIPVRQELISNEVVRKIVKDGAESITYSFIIKMTTKIVEVAKPENFVEVESFGHGLDSGDKGFGKASTYARKYALLNAYKIATGEDPDAEKSEETKVVTQDKKRDDVLNYLMQNDAYRSSIFQHFSVGEIGQLTDSNITTIYNNLKKKRLL